MKQRCTLKELLTTQRALIGLLQTHPNFALAEMAGMCGYDFLLLDGEHGVFGESDYLPTLRAIATTRALAIVRLGNHDTQALGRYLDMGADAILVPNVSTAEQARNLVRAMAYPPAGTDLVGRVQTPRGGGGGSLMVIIESALGASNAEEILGVEDVDGVIIGPSDLTADLGWPG